MRCPKNVEIHRAFIFRARPASCIGRDDSLGLGTAVPHGNPLSRKWSRSRQKANTGVADRPYIQDWSTRRSTLPFLFCFVSRYFRFDCSFLHLAVVVYGFEPEFLPLSIPGSHLAKRLHARTLLSPFLPKPRFSTLSAAFPPSSFPLPYWTTASISCSLTISSPRAK